MLFKRVNMAHWLGKWVRTLAGPISGDFREGILCLWLTLEPVPFSRDADFERTWVSIVFYQQFPLTNFRNKTNICLSVFPNSAECCFRVQLMFLIIICNYSLLTLWKLIMKIGVCVFSINIMRTKLNILRIKIMCMRVCSKNWYGKFKLQIRSMAGKVVKSPCIKLNVLFFSRNLSNKGETS